MYHREIQSFLDDLPAMLTRVKARNEGFLLSDKIKKQFSKTYSSSRENALMDMHFLSFFFEDDKEPNKLVKFMEAHGVKSKCEPHIDNSNKSKTWYFVNFTFTGYFRKERRLVGSTPDWSASDKNDNEMECLA